MDSFNFKIQDWVDLNSYSDSKGWKGYCRRNKPFTFFRANKIVNSFSTFFREYTNSVMIISNVFRKKECTLTNSNIGYYIKYIEKYLADFNYIKTKSNSIYNDPNCLYQDFKIINGDYDIVSMFSLLTMMDDRIDGHCFFVFEELGLIAYPHDDTGFGFIRIKNTSIHYEEIFLEKVSHFSGFISSR